VRKHNPKSGKDPNAVTEQTSSRESGYWLLESKLYEPCTTHPTPSKLKMNRLPCECMVLVSRYSQFDRSAWMKNGEISGHHEPMGSAIKLP